MIATYNNNNSNDNDEDNCDSSNNNHHNDNNNTNGNNNNYNSSRMEIGLGEIHFSRDHDACADVKRDLNRWFRGLRVLGLRLQGLGLGIQGSLS